MAQFNLYSDRSVQRPGRFRLTDVDSGLTQSVDVTRTEGIVYQEGTPFLADIMNRFADEIADAGQDFADELTDGWSTLPVNSTWFTGSVKYKQIGSMVVVYANLYQTGGEGGTSQAISGAVELTSSNLPSEYRPATNKTGDFRPISNLSGYNGYKPYMQVTTTGKIFVQCNGINIPSTRYIRGEVVYEV